MELLSLEKLEAIATDYGYWAVFLGIALENTGIPLPGETITLVGGFLAGNGELRYPLVLGSAIAGAVIGDNFGYWLGRWGGWPLLQRLGSFFKIPEFKLEEARNQFSRNAAQAVFLGRFVALLRIFAGPMAGIAQMSYGKFLLCNLAGATVWALTMVTLSYTVGKLIPLEQLVQWTAQFAIIALMIVIAGLVLPEWWKSRQQSPGK